MSGVKNESVVRLRAHAKVNLCLSVGRAIEGGTHAGMHPIASWMSAIELADEVEVARLGEGEASRFDLAWADGTAVAWPVESDLAVRAHGLLEREAGRRLPIGLRVRKRIPAGGGLGGGSSDAAAVLVGVDAVFGLGFGADRLRALSAELGSDVAFFVDEVPLGAPPRPAVVTGVGDVVERVPAISCGLTLLLPGFGCPTGAVYRTFDGLVESGVESGVVRADAVRAAALAGEPADGVLFNDLAAAAEAAVPALAAARTRIGAALGRVVHVSGSGSTLFVLGTEGFGVPAGVRAVRSRTL